jgi:hypothetical protein
MMDRDHARSDASQRLDTDKRLPLTALTHPALFTFSTA